ncbi:Iron(III) dicitrate transport system permease protein fecD [Escherichia coli]|uniref:Iron(III) dicitrate transport system permease protein fecD n=1 Tax=Escherichia coli TaxID=562 RepID=A0A447X8Y3_ECOLX|nr:Iron(III) dicitrate transport system permease protein fecD [Escherichia coli]
MKIALVIFITLALAGCALLSLHMGVIPVPWRALLTDWQAGREHYYVLMEYRLPRLLLALFVGAALAVAGVLIQGIVRTLWHHRIFSALTMPPAWPLWGLYFLCRHCP